MGRVTDVDARKQAPHTEQDSAAEPRRRMPHPRDWALWRRPKRFIVFLIVMELLSIPVFVAIFAKSTAPTGTDWVRFAILAVGATVHIQLTRRQEERRRNRSPHVLIDLIAVWVFPAILVLPSPLVVALVLVTRVQRWYTARRPPHNFVFAAVSHSLAAALAHVTYTALGPGDWHQAVGWATLREFALVLVAAAVYEGVQVVYIGGVLALSQKHPTVRTVLGSRADNMLEAVTTGLGAMTAVLLVTMPPTVAIMAVVTVVFNRLAELEQLQDDVVTDSKTGLLNMRGWSESAERALARVSRANGTLAVLMIDLDHFKWINDTFGHPAGDDVLTSVATALGQVTRPADIVGRFGGEEFLVLLPDTDTEDAAHAAERVRGTIADLRIETTDKRGAQITIAERTSSIGVAVFPHDAETVRGLVQAADAAVYEAKERGRNQVRFQPPHNQ